MPFARNGEISQSPLEGGVEITDSQYAEALEGMLLGKVVNIDGGFSVLWPPESDPDPVDPGELPVSLVEVAGARLSVDKDNWSVSGVDRSKGIAGADLVDDDVVWVFFSAPQPDIDYIVVPDSGVTKFTDFVEVSRPGLANITFIIQRVQ